MNMSQLKRLVRKLRITSNSVVLVRKISEDGQNEKNLARELAEAIKQSNLHDVFVIIMEDFDNLATYDVNAMNKIGWFRKEQVLALFKKMATNSAPVKQEERTEDDQSGSV